MTLPLLSQFNPETGEVAGFPAKLRYLENLRGFVLDEKAYQEAREHGNPVIYCVTSVEPAHGDGQLHYGLGKIMHGKIGREYFFTLGHLHEFRPAAEFYIGLSGEGLMLLQEESSGETQVQPLKPNWVIYVPGYTAHRTVNVGTVPLTYLGIYSAQAGHDYGTIAECNFNKVVIEVDGQPVVMDRQEAARLIRESNSLKLDHAHRSE